MVTVLERILAVLTLERPGTRALVTRLLQQQDVSPDSRAVFDDVLVAWRNAGVGC